MEIIKAKNFVMVEALLIVEVVPDRVVNKVSWWLD